jgi:hypothetical protein
MQLHIQGLLEKNQQTLFQAFLSTMDRDITTLEAFTILLSVLPASRFGNTGMTLSVIDEIFHHKERDYLAIFIHELSHIIRNMNIGEIYDKV